MIDYNFNLYATYVTTRNSRLMACEVRLICWWCKFHVWPLLNLGVTPEKAKSISQEENRKLKDHLESVVKELNAKMGTMDNKLESLDGKNKEIEKSVTDLESKKPAEPVEKKQEKPKNQRVLLTSLNSQSNIELDENLQNQLKQMSEEIKEHQSVSIENEEQIQQINKRLSTLEGGSAGVLGFLERVDEVSSTLTLWHPPHCKLSIDFYY